jgi:molecular chaperone DnaJ
MAANYYDILGVAKNATQDEIKKAFRKKAHELHPDKKTGDEKKFKEANEAYQVLSDTQKRSQYDQYGQTFSGAGSQGNGGPGAGFGGYDFSGFDFGSQGGGFGGFEDMFGDIFGGGGRRRARRGADIQVDVEIDIFEAAKGVKKTIPLRRKVTCKTCTGTGGKPGSKEETCTNCQGSGQVKKIMRTILGTFEQPAECDVCHGRGKTYSEKCTVCSGEGRVTESEQIDIEIPAGIDDGQALSMSSKGEAGEHGTAPGDLIIAVHVKPHAKLKRQGNTISSLETLSITQAALGASVEVQTLEGNITIKIPAGTQPGEVFRLRGKGMPSLHGRHQGDHMVTIQVEIPKKLSKKVKEALTTLAKEL